jgi:hypothetical protein
MLVCAFVSAQAAFSQPADTNATGADARWYVISTNNGAQIGYASQEIVRGSDGGHDTITTQSLSLQERGSPISTATERTVISDDAYGVTRSIVARTQNGPAWSRTEATISGHHAHIARETPAGRWTGETDLPAGARFDDGAALLREWDPTSQPRLEFDDFSISGMSVEHVVIVATPANGANTALRLRYQNGALLGVARLSLDRGEIIDMARPMFGATIHVRVADRRTALAAHAPYEVLPNAMTRSPFRISSPASIAHLRYHFSFRDGLAFPLPQTGEQRAIDDSGSVAVDICRGCGSGLPTDAAALADALKPTAWMQSDNPRLRAIAAPIGRLPVTGERKMQMLMERAQRYFTRIDFVGHYSALDTLSRHAGDCTEAATLLAALGRAAGIPTKVASGLVYSRESYHGVSNAFLPHSWTLAYVDGHWRSFDLALQAFDSTHIALTIGDGDERSIAAAGQLASLLVIDAVAEVRLRS